MEKISVKASKCYDILIEKGILNNCGEYIRDITNAKTAAVITDDNVDKLYFDTVKSSLLKNDFKVVKFVFTHGEENKSLKTISDILSFLSKNELTRSDIIVALGGGIVGDVAGFASSIYLRGIDFIQIPTTLLACVDSSVGGKTGVNLPEGKNLAGAFHQPSLVLIDAQCFDYLSDEIYADGIAECIKYAIITDLKLFELLEKSNARDNIEEIIKICVSIKADIVCRDEFDTGERQKLNLGHTVGHAIEKCSNFEISHGHAVAIGTVIACRAAFKLGLCADIEKDVCDCLKKYNLPTSTNFKIDDLITVMLNDKKRSGDFINLILPTRIGNVEVIKVNIKELKEILS